MTARDPICMRAAPSPSKQTTSRSGSDIASPSAIEEACPIPPTVKKSIPDILSCVLRSSSSRPSFPVVATTTLSLGITSIIALIAISRDRSNSVAFSTASNLLSKVPLQTSKAIGPCAFVFLKIRKSSTSVADVVLFITK